MHRYVVISGCSGGGKSTLLAALRERGYSVVEEPGRRIVQEELLTNGSALPWMDAAAFAQRAISMAIADWEAAAGLQGWIFFDRGLIDAASALEHIAGERVLAELGERYRYHRRVFFAPPWREIYRTDEERPHGFDAAEREYFRLREDYPTLGYEITSLPKVDTGQRAEFVLRTLEGPSS